MMACLRMRALILVLGMSGLAIGETTGMLCVAISSQAGWSSVRNAVTTRCVTALGTTLRYIERWSAANSNSRRMRARASPPTSAVAAANATENALATASSRSRKC